jgi:hypothetical protein
LLPGSLALYLLLLSQNFPLTLLLHLLAHAFALGLSRITGLCGSLLFNLLPPQILHLLPRVAIATRGLPGEVGHLPFPRLLCGYVRLRTRLRAVARLLTIVSPLLAGRSTLICDLKFLAPRPISDRLNV